MRSVVGTYTVRLHTLTKRFLAQASISLIVGGIASVDAAQVAATVPQGQRIRNIVLVHGAWADGSGWRGV